MWSDMGMGASCWRPLVNEKHRLEWIFNLLGFTLTGQGAQEHASTGLSF